MSQQGDIFSTVEEAVEETARDLGSVRPRHTYLPYTRVKEVRKILEKGKIPLGGFDPDFTTELYSIPFTGKSMCVLCSGGSRGIGKTYDMGTYFFDMLEPFKKIHRIAFDPKHEFWTRKKPNLKMAHQLKRIGMTPIGHPNLTRVTPKCVYNRVLDQGLMTQYNTRHLTRLDLITMMNLNPDKMEDSRYIEKMDYVLYGKTYEQATQDGKPIDFAQLRRQRLPDIETIMNRLWATNDTVLRQKIQSLMALESMGEDRNINLIDLLNQNKLVVYQTTFRRELYGVMASYIATELRSIINERMLIVEHGGKKKTRLPYPVFMYFGEFNVYYPRAPLWRSSKEPITQVYDQMRAMGLSIWGDSPNFYSLESRSIQQSDYILTFKITGKNLKVIRDERGLSMAQADELKELFVDKNSTPPAEIAVLPSGLNPGDELTRIFPFPSLSVAQQEQSFST